ncbi:MAG TPA: Tol-Pal system beta propeller repeat protein TolB [Rhodanobacteraceae bacterium]|nr:Tol-Pal system beta propeller repeat protein TolB [Rhodanobacteraceae bacterium]
MTAWRTIRNGLLLALVVAVCGAGGRASAQGLTLDIVNGVPSAVPIAVVPFSWEGSGVPPATDVASVIGMDLNRSGQFRTLPKDDVVEFPHRGNDVKFATWKLLKQDYLVIGRQVDAGNGAVRVEFELYDVPGQRQLLALSVTGQPADLRGVAHQIADLIYEKITGVRGAFWTRVAYITATGTGHNMEYSLVVADSDGHNPQVVVRSHETLMSPSWSPDGGKIAYVSFESGNSAIYIQDLSTGSRRLVSSHSGINGAPAFSPDGTKLAMSLSYVGNPEIFVMDLATGDMRRLTHHFSIDTEPEWTPDGQSLVFTSDRSGKPQLYQIAATGGTPERLTFSGEYNSDASVGFRNKRIAMVQGAGNVYRIAIMDRGLGGQEHMVSPGNMDESPSFAPNASMLLYAASDGARGVLYAVSADGRVRQRLVLANGDVREPAWGPFRPR